MQLQGTSKQERQLAIAELIQRTQELYGRGTSARIFPDMSGRVLRPYDDAVYFHFNGLDEWDEELRKREGKVRIPEASLAQILQAVKCRYGTWAQLRVYPDNSGSIFSGACGEGANETLIHFDSLGDLLNHLGI